MAHSLDFSWSKAFRRPRLRRRLRGEHGHPPEYQPLTEAAGAAVSGRASVVERLGTSSYADLATALGPAIVQAGRMITSHPGMVLGPAFDMGRAHAFGADGKALAIRG
jgi:hypothetical protein